MNQEPAFYDRKTTAWQFRTSPDFLLYGFFHDQNDYARHYQEFTEIVFILSGTAEHYTPPSANESISRGDIMVIPAGGIHGFYNTRKLKIFNLLFVANRLPLPTLELYTHPGYRYMFMHPTVFYDCAGHYPRITVSEDKIRHIEFYLKQFVEFEEQRKNTEQCCGILGVFMVLLCLLCDEWQTRHPDKHFDIPLDIARITKYINDYYAEKITLKNLMKLTAMSENTLFRHFRKAFGRTPMQYLQEFRLANAAAKLLETAMRVNEISLSCGFYTPAYFIKAFKRAYKMTPEQFRRHHDNFMPFRCLKNNGKTT